MTPSSRAQGWGSLAVVTDHSDPDSALRADVRLLGGMLGETLVRQHGQELLDVVEEVRRLAKVVREAQDPEASDRAATTLVELLDAMDLDRTIQLVRAFSMYFALANVAVVWALVLNGLRWFASRSDIRQYVSLRRSGELQTEQFHDTIEQTHLGFFHKYARSLGLLRYDYMTDD